MDTPLPEVHLPGDPLPNILGLSDIQRLRKDDVCNNEGTLGVPTPDKDSPPFRSQYGCEAAPYCASGLGIPDCRLGGNLAPTTLPDGVVRDSPVQV